MNVKVLGFICFMLVLNGVLPGTISKKDVSPKPVDEDVYGDLEGGNPDLQQDQDYYDGDADPAPEEDTGGSDNEIDIKLISKPETFILSTPSVVMLPCQASTDDVVRVWSKNGTLLIQGTINTQNKKNIKLYPNGSLEVSIQDEDDYGRYACKLVITETSKPEIVHTIARETRPTIVALYANDNRTLFNPGDTLSLTCQATGVPKPKISWHLSGERLVPEGESLVIPQVKGEHSGSYRCLADNNVDKPAHKHIDIYVNHAPIVSVEKYIVNSDHESDAEFVCEVKAYPVPAVNWQKDGQNLVNNEPKIKLTSERNNERNILIIRDISENDFGIYSCVASNALGREQKNATLVRTPVINNLERLFKASENVKDIILQWRVESKQPIKMHELQYRRKGEMSWTTISPEVTEGQNDVYLIKHTLKNLEPGIYETRARSQNKHGWSDYSTIMPFNGAKHGLHHQKPKHTKKEQKELKTSDSTHDTPAQHRSEAEISPIGESKKSSSTSPYSSVFLISLTLFSTYFSIRQ